MPKNHPFLAARMSELEETNEAILGERLSSLHSSLAQSIILCGIITVDDSLNRAQVREFIQEITSRLVHISKASSEIDRKALQAMIMAFTADWADTFKPV